LESVRGKKTHLWGGSGPKAKKTYGFKEGKGGKKKKPFGRFSSKT